MDKAGIKHDPRNARRHTPRNLSVIEQSIQRDGFGRSILLANDGTVIAGNATIDAAASAGLDDVIVVETDGTKVVAVKRTDVAPGSEQFHKLALADNRAAELAEWDETVLAELNQEMDLSAFFQDDELAKLLSSVTTDGLTDPDDVPTVTDATTKPGDLWLLGDHFLYCGDSTYRDEVSKALQGRKADIVFTDPPYGVNVSGKGGKAIAGDLTSTAIFMMFDVLPHAIAPGAWLYICGGSSNFAQYARLFEHHFQQLPHVIIWDKGKTAVMRQNGYHSCYEMIYWTFVEGGGSRWFSSRTSDDADDIWRVQVDSTNNRWHPTQKPVELPARAIRNSCPPNGIVFDPFAGTGSTLIASEKERRKCVAIEMSPEYCDVVIQRWEDFTGRKAVLDAA